MAIRLDGLAGGRHDHVGPLDCPEWIQKDATAVDLGWSAALGVLGVFYALFAPGNPSRRALIGFLVGFWSFRLSSLLFRRVISKKEEDPRHQRLRALRGDEASGKGLALVRGGG